MLGAGSNVAALAAGGVVDELPAVLVRGAAEARRPLHALERHRRALFEYNQPTRASEQQSTQADTQKQKRTTEMYEQQNKTEEEKQQHIKIDFQARKRN